VAHHAELAATAAVLLVNDFRDTRFGQNLYWSPVRVGPFYKTVPRLV
jgi:hypothetical protein